MSWIRLAYGTLVAAGMMLTGYGLYQRHATSTLQIQDAAFLCEAVMERSAAVAAWPWTADPTNAAGWDIFYYRTNVEGTVLWSFNDFRLSGVPIVRKTPLFGSVVPIRALSECLRQTKAIVPSFARSVQANEYGYVVPTYWTVEELWQAIGIGDGTSKWTIAYSTNGLPLYGESASSWCTTAVEECWRVLNALTTTVHAMTLVASSNYYSRQEWDRMWNLSSNGPSQYTLETIPPLDVNGIPPDGPNTLAEPINVFRVADLSAWDTNYFYNGIDWDDSGEALYAQAKLQAIYTRRLDQSDYLPSDTEHVDVMDVTLLYADDTFHWGDDWWETAEVPYKMHGRKKDQIWRLQFPTFPSGVQARAEARWPVHLVWSRVGYDEGGVKATDVLDMAYTVTSAPVSLAWSTAISDVAFTNMDVTVGASITSAVPGGLLEMRGWLDVWDVRTNGPFGYVTELQWFWWQDDLELGGRANVFGLPLTIVNWNWIYH